MGNRHMMVRRCVHGLRGGIALAALAGVSFVASAQTTAESPITQPEAAAAESGTPQSEIVVTGTRISGFSAPTPVTTVDQTTLADRAVRNVADLLTDIPAFKVNQNTGASSSPVGASNLDLRGLGPNRTLLLLDGRRVAATDPTGGIDINVIPATLISRLDIVTGGASAAYGSDAVSGVVNIFLDNKFTGVRGSAQYGQTRYNDIKSPGVSLAVGEAFFDDRLHVVAAGDYFKNNGQLEQQSRPWARGNYAVITNPAATATNGQPLQIISPNARFSQMNYASIVTGTGTSSSIASARALAARLGYPAGTAITFNSAGQPIPFNYGTNVGTTYMTGGDGISLAPTANILPKLERKSAYGRATFDVSEQVSIFADALWSRADIYSDGTTATDNGTIVIQRDNAFLPAALRALIPTTGPASAQTLRIGRVAGEDGAFTNVVDNEVQRYGFGVDGRFGGWKWNAFAQLSRNHYYREDGNNRNETRFLLGLDSVINPANGQAICRARLANPASTNPDIATCVPINPFGAGSINQAALDYYKGVATLDSRQSQNVYSINLEGSPFATWAGEVSLAVGAEYRNEKVRARTDAISQALGWKTVNPQPVAGKLNVKEAYLELVVPLLKDSPLASALDVNGAVRTTDYSTSGNVTTWKLGVNYSPIPDLRIRGTVSRDIRAANINELFSGQSTFINTVTDPRNNTQRSVPQLTGGNPALTPERANTFTVGAVYQPSWAPSLRLAVDYYSIEIKNAITSLTPQQIVDGCYRFNQAELCSAITQDAANVITRVQATLINAAGAASKGIDFEAAYTVPLQAGARIDFRALANYVTTLSTTLNGVTTNYAGNVGSTATVGPAGGVPKWRGSFAVNYRDERITVGTFLRYVGGGKYNSTFVEGVNIDDNSVPSRTYVDMNAGYRVTPQIELFASVDNVFNVKPPLTPNAITAPSYAGSIFYDRFGTFYQGGVRFRF